ncbi:MAG: outer membrane protein assembly factor BamD [Bacteroidota bacterium]|nr:outer membrane protein assembly factor BamD [Bacteroidota bacterium]
MKGKLFFLVSVILLSSCSSQFNKIMRSKDANYKLKMADSYYAQKRYKYAEELYQELFSVFKGTEKFEELYYKYAYCSYYEGNYADAENLFKGFLEVFPNSDKAEEIAYMHAYTYYMQSPKVELDQANTIKAIGVMQTFIGTHPNSPRIKEANEVIAKCRAKLELKDYKTAQLYYNLEDYRAAGLSFTDLLNSYPESSKGDTYMLMAVKSYYEFAKLSIYSKEEERYQKVASEYFDFADRYPDSKLLKQAEYYKNQSQNNIKKIENEQAKTPAKR